MSWDKDVYYSPEKLGLTIVGEIDWVNAPYEFDLTVVWKDAEGKLYWYSDAGCSCPSPFEDVRSLDELETGPWPALSEYLAKQRDVRRDSWSLAYTARGDTFDDQIAAIMTRVVA